MAEEVAGPLRNEFLPDLRCQPDPGQRRLRPELSGQQDSASGEWADPPAPEEHVEVDVRLLPRWMGAGRERGPPEGEETQAEPKPAELRERNDPSAW